MYDPLAYKGSDSQIRGSHYPDFLQLLLRCEAAYYVIFLLTSDFQWMPTKKTNLFSHCIVYFKFAYNLHMIGTIVSTDVCLILGGFRTIIAF